MKIDPKAFNKAFRKVEHLAKARSSMPITSHILVSIGTEGVELAASNNDATAVASVPTPGEKQEAFCIPADALGKIIQGAGDRELTVNVLDGKLQVVAPFKATIPTLAAKEFPVVPKPDRKSCLGINCEDLAKGIRQVAWAANVKAAEMDLWRSAVRIVTTPNAIVCTATDAKTLAHWTGASIGAASSVMIPCQYADMLADSISGENSDYYVSEKAVFGVSDGLMISVRRIEGNYPSIEQFLNGAKLTIGEIVTKDFQRELNLCCGVIGGDFIPTVGEFSEAGLTIGSANGEGREFEAVIPGVFTKHTFKFNAVLTSEILGHFDAEKITVDSTANALLLTAGELVCAVQGLH